MTQPRTSPGDRDENKSAAKTTRRTETNEAGKAETANTTQKDGDSGEDGEDEEDEEGDEERGREKAKPTTTNLQNGTKKPKTGKRK
jgi:hypothetical protein